MSDSHESINKWESSLDSSLVERLSKPLVKPGVINGNLSKSVFLRNGLMVNKHPLLNRLMKKTRHNESVKNKNVPIVYKTIGNGIYSSNNNENINSVNPDQKQGQKVVNVSENKNSRLINRKIGDRRQTKEQKNLDNLDNMEVRKKSSTGTGKAEKSLKKTADPGVIKKGFSYSILRRANSSALNSPFTSLFIQRQINKQSKLTQQFPNKILHTEKSSGSVHKKSENTYPETTISPQNKNYGELQLKPVDNVIFKYSKTQNPQVHKNEITISTEQENKTYNKLNNISRNVKKDSNKITTNVLSKKPDTVKTYIQKKEKLYTHENKPNIKKNNYENIKIAPSSASHLGEMNIESSNKGSIEEQRVLPAQVYSFPTKQNIHGKYILQKSPYSSVNRLQGKEGNVVVQNGKIHNPVINKTERNIIWRKSTDGESNNLPLTKNSLNNTNVQHKYGLAGNTALISRQTDPGFIMPSVDIPPNSQSNSDNFTSHPPERRRGGIDINRIAERVSKILYKKLLIEKERRGHGRWD